MDFENEIFGVEGETETLLEYRGEDDIIFTNCTFINCKIIAEVPYMEFDDCKIIGNLKVNNKGVGDLDTVRLYGVKLAENEVGNINISSTSVAIHSSKLMGDDRQVHLVGDELEILDSDIAGHTITEHLMELNISESNLRSLEVIGSRDGVIINNSVINGVEIKDAQNNNLDTLIK